MKNVLEIARRSNDIVAKDISTWITVYYSAKEDAVYMEPGKDRLAVTRLIYPHTPQEIEEAVEKYL